MNFASYLASSDSAATITLGSAGALTVPAYTTLQGLTSGTGATLTNLITIDAHQASRVLNVPSTGVIIANLTVANGSVTTDAGGGLGMGGGVRNTGSMTVMDCTFLNNSALNGGYGGAIVNAGTMNVVGSTFTQNTTTNNGLGSAIYNYYFATLTVSNSTFTGNVTNTRGDAVYNRGTMTVQDSTFSMNSAGIANFGTATISNSILAGDTFNECLGIGCPWSTPTIYLVIASTGQGNGSDHGVITLTLTDSQGNQYSESVTTVSASSPAGIAASFGAYFSEDYGIGAEAFGSVLIMQFGNDTLTITNPTVSFTVTQTNFDILGTTNVVGAMYEDAHLTPLGSYGGPTQTMLPLPSNPAICSSSPSTATGTDQRGLPRTTTFGTTTCQDAGAVQSNYSLAFTQQPSAVKLGAAIAPSPTVQLNESGVAAPFGGTSIGIGATSGTLGGVKQQSTSSAGLATFSGLTVQSGPSSNSLVASLSAGSNTISATSGSFNVMLLDHLGLSGVPSTVTAGTSFPVTVTAYADAGGTVATSYAGPVYFLSSDPSATLPTVLSLAGGVGTFTITLATGGAQTITVADSSGSPSLTSGSIQVSLLNPTLSLGVASHVYGDAPFAVSAESNSKGIFTYSVVSGPATIQDRP